MSIPEPPDLNVIREAIRNLTEMFKELVEHPEIIDSWEPAQRAWMAEHIELLMEDTKGLRDDIEKLLGRRLT